MLNSLISIVNSNFFVGLVGFLAIYLYFFQKKDKKQEAARLILQEIRYAEQQIRNSQKGINKELHHVYPLSSKLLPTNSWNDNIHLFLRNLEESEIDLISRFYSKAEYIDVLINKISEFKTSPKNIHPMSGAPIQPVVAVQPSQQAIPGPMVLKPIIVDLMEDTQDILQQVSEGIEFVYNTPVGEKLKVIAKRKWMQYFWPVI